MLVPPPAIQHLTIPQLQVTAELFILGEGMDRKEWGARQPCWHSPALSVSVNQPRFSTYTILGSKV